MIHAGPNLLLCFLARLFHVIGMRKTVRSVTRKCIICRRQSIKPQPHLFGQLPSERITPDSAFNQVGIDYAGPILVKIWNGETAHCSQSICMHICISLRKSCAPQGTCSV